MKWNSTIGFMAGLALFAGVGVCGPDWEEPTGDDAGDTPNDAQVTKGSNSLNTIMGKLDGNGNLAALGPAAGPADFQDMYLVRIVSPGTFGIATVQTAGGSGSASFDTQLFVFRADGFGILANDNEAIGTSGSLLTGDATDASGFILTVPGLYYIAVSGFNSDPLATPGGLPIFTQTSRVEVSGPDGPGATAGPVGSWSAAGAVGTYVIAVAGCAPVWVCDGDANGDGVVDVNDISYVLFRLGESDEPGADVNEDGVVDVSDISYVLFRLGDCV